MCSLDNLINSVYTVLVAYYHHSVQYYHAKFVKKLIINNYII